LCVYSLDSSILSDPTDDMFTLKDIKRTCSKRSLKVLTMFQQRPRYVPRTSPVHPANVLRTSRERVNDVLLTSKEPYTMTSGGRSQRPFRGRSGDLLLLAGRLEANGKSYHGNNAETQLLCLTQPPTHARKKHICNLLKSHM